MSHPRRICSCRCLPQACSRCAHQRRCWITLSCERRQEAAADGADERKPGHRQPRYRHGPYAHKHAVYERGRRGRKEMRDASTGTAGPRPITGCGSTSGPSSDASTRVVPTSLPSDTSSSSADWAAWRASRDRRSVYGPPIRTRRGIPSRARSPAKISPAKIASGANTRTKPAMFESRVGASASRRTRGGTTTAVGNSRSCATKTPRQEGHCLGKCSPVLQRSVYFCKLALQSCSLTCSPRILAASASQHASMPTCNAVRNLCSWSGAVSVD